MTAAAPKRSSENSAPWLSKVFHYHLKKCGGASINWWMKQYVPDRCDIHASAPQSLSSTALDDPEAVRKAEALEEPIGRQIFYCGNWQASHLPFVRWAPEGTFCFTVMRDPEARLLSQVADWRRLEAHDVATLSSRSASLVLESAQLPLDVYLAKWGRGAGALDNYLARALAAASIGVRAMREDDMASLAHIAAENLESRFDFVGIAERPQATLGRLADLLGCPPEPIAPRRNRTDSSRLLAEESKTADELLEELTAFDRPLYALALRRFAEQHEARGGAYDRDQFERRRAAGAVAGLKGSSRGPDVVFSVHEPLIGWGFHGRDGAGLGNCCVWSGPSRVFVIYMPTPANVRLQARLWVRGYANGRQRASLTVAVDGAPHSHRFEPEAGYADVLVVETTSKRSFLALEIALGETSTAGEPGSSSFDSRERGLAFDQYGWRIATAAD
jgi:hypothetical protein